ncbi:hypothetical protein JTY60_00430 [symbiont of Argiope bruennichi]|uniref:hypothetical protein n=1 Tax=symbiont of Argiope bruennichi TaxID=2810479 RepID=UPI003DA1F26A
MPKKNISELAREHNITRSSVYKAIERDKPQNTIELNVALEKVKQNKQHYQKQITKDEYIKVLEQKIMWLENEVNNLKFKVSKIELLETSIPKRKWWMFWKKNQ